MSEIRVVHSMAELVEALREKPSGEEKLGPELPLNEAAIAEQKRHVAAIDELWPKAKAALKAMQRLEEDLKDEQNLWAGNMRKAMPELAKHDNFKLNDAGTHYRVVLTGDEGSSQPEPLAKQPEWVKQMIKDMEGDHGEHGPN